MRRTIAADGSEKTVASVPCPKNDRFQKLADCKRCEDFGGAVDDTGALTALCRHRGRVLPVLPPGSPEVRGLANGTSVAEITRSVVCVEKRVSVAQAAALILDLGVAGLPVVDERGRPVGVVSKTDLVRHAYHPGPDARDGSVTVSAVMSPDPLTISEHESVAEAAGRMVEEAVHRLLVISAKGTLLGIVSPLDVLEWISR